MIIKKFQGNSKEEAIALAREELGDQVVIMNIKEVRENGMLGIFKKSTYEVTGAVEDGVLGRPSYRDADTTARTGVNGAGTKTGGRANLNTANAASVATAATTPSANTSIFGRSPRTVTPPAQREREELPHNFSVAADENIKVPPVENAAVRDEEQVEAIRDAFKAVDEVIKSGALQNVENRSGERNSNIIPRENVREIPGTVTVKNSFEPVEQPDPGIYRRPAGTPLSHTQPLPRIENAEQPALPPIEVAPTVPQQSTIPSPVNVSMSPGASEQKVREAQSTEQARSRTENREHPRTQDMNFVKMLYRVLLKNEIDERYINQLIEDMEKVISSGNSLDYMISNVYQKMVLTMGKPQTIEFTPGKKPKVVFLVGPTGVGKTTTIAKLAARHKINLDKRVALVTSDEYRIAAVEQLRKYASIMDMPMLDISKSQNVTITEALERLKEYDLVFVDTTGFSHRNEEQRQNVADLINAVDPEIDKEVYLVLSVTTKYKDLKEIIDAYKSFTKFHLIFTKLDESEAHGNILNCKLYSGAELSYVTTGQEVPEDIEVVDTQRMVKQFLGG